MPLPSAYTPVKNLIDKAITSTYTNQHAVSGHVTRSSTKSFFTNSVGETISAVDALRICNTAGDKALSVLSRGATKNDERGIEVVRIRANAGKIGVAVTWGEVVGQTPSGTNLYECKWVVIIFLSTLASRSGGQYSKIATAYPATDRYVRDNKYTAPTPTRIPVSVAPVTSAWG